MQISLAYTAYRFDELSEVLEKAALDIQRANGPEKLIETIHHLYFTLKTCETMKGDTTDTRFSRLIEHALSSLIGLETFLRKYNKDLNPDVLNALTQIALNNAPFMSIALTTDIKLPGVKRNELNA